MAILKSTFSTAALIAAAISLSGCVSLSGILDGGGDGGGDVDPPSVQPIGNALGYTLKANCKDKNCKLTGPVIRDLNMSAALTNTATSASVTVSDANSGLVDVTDVPFKESLFGGGFKIYDNDKGDQDVEASKQIYVGSHYDDDQFFFFESNTQQVTSKSTEDGVSFNAAVVRSVSGNLTPTNKLKTATFKGGANVEALAFSGQVDGAYPLLGNVSGKGDLTLNADLSAKTVNGKIENFSARDEEDAYAPLEGASIELKNGMIEGSQFGNGSLTLKAANGSVITEMSKTQSNFVGGFYGTDMNYAAGVLLGAGEAQDGKIYLLEGTFWGQAQNPAQ